MIATTYYSYHTQVRRSSLSLGASTLPDINKDAGDRNRTSPFAFTGNRFEFRAVGSEQSLAPATIVLNTIMAESLDVLTDMLEERLHSKQHPATALEYAAKAVIRDNYREHGRVVFNGDGYSDAWKAEAQRRGLKNLTQAPQAIAEYGAPETIEMFEKCSVLSESELMAQKEVFLDKYTKKVGVEVNCALRMVRSTILPVCRRYQSQLAQDVINVKEALGVESAAATAKDELIDLTNTIDDMCDRTRHLEKERDALQDDDDDDEMARAEFAAEHLVPSLEALREPVDQLETIVSNDMWPLPTYQELLHMKSSTAP